MTFFSPLAHGTGSILCYLSSHSKIIVMSVCQSVYTDMNLFVQDSFRKIKDLQTCGDVQVPRYGSSSWVREDLSSLTLPHCQSPPTRLTLEAKTMCSQHQNNYADTWQCTHSKTWQFKLGQGRPQFYHSATLLVSANQTLTGSQDNVLTAHRYKYKWRHIAQ